MDAKRAEHLEMKTELRAGSSLAPATGALGGDYGVEPGPNFNPGATFATMNRDHADRSDLRGDIGIQMKVDRYGGAVGEKAAGDMSADARPTAQ